MTNFLTFFSSGDKSSGGGGQGSSKSSNSLKHLNESSNSGNSSGDESLDDSPSLMKHENRPSNHGNGNERSGHGQGIDNYHQVQSIQSQSAASVASSVSGYHTGFKFNHSLSATPSHPQVHHYGDVTSALVMPHSTAETMLQLSAAAAAAAVDYSGTLGPLGSIGNTTHHPSAL